MHEGELIEALAQRTGTTRELAAKMIHALADLVREARRAGDFMPLSRFGAFCSEACRDFAAAQAVPPSPSAATLEATSAPLQWEPEPGEAEALLEQAKHHPLGLEFLLRGELGAVTAMFHTHAFLVEAVRRYHHDRLDSRKSASSPETQGGAH